MRFWLYAMLYRTSSIPWLVFLLASVRCSAIPHGGHKIGRRNLVRQSVLIYQLLASELTSSPQEMTCWPPGPPDSAPIQFRTAEEICSKTNAGCECTADAQQASCSNPPGRASLARYQQFCEARCTCEEVGSAYTELNGQGADDSDGASESGSDREDDYEPYEPAAEPDTPGRGKESPTGFDRLGSCELNDTAAGYTPMQCAAGGAAAASAVATTAAATSQSTGPPASSGSCKAQGCTGQQDCAGNDRATNYAPTKIFNWGCTSCLAVQVLGGVASQTFRCQLPPNRGKRGLGLFGCACNGSYVSEECCFSAIGHVHEPAESKLGELWRDRLV